jgi:AraC-like DNA-binding protein
MEALQPVVLRHSDNSYDQKPELIEPIFELFRREADGQYLMRDVSQKTHMSITTLYSW